MSPNLRSQKREVQNSEPKPSIDTMTMKTIEKELKKHGVNAVDVLRNKLKELTDEEAPVVADTNPATKSAPAKSRGNTDDVMELPVPLIAEEIPVRLTRSRVAEQVKRSASPKREKRQHKRSGLSMPDKKRKIRKISRGDDAEYDVEKILDIRVFMPPNSKTPSRELKIRWSGYTEEHDMWVDESNLALNLDEYEKDPIVIEKIASGFVDV